MLSDGALDDIDKLARPEWLHQGFVGISPSPRHLKQVAAHHDGLRAKMRGSIGDDRAIAIRQLPVGYYQRIRVGVKVCPSFGGCGRQVHEIPFTPEHVHQEDTDSIVVLNQEEALPLFRHEENTNTRLRAEPKRLTRPLVPLANGRTAGPRRKSPGLFATLRPEAREISAPCAPSD